MRIHFQKLFKIVNDHITRVYLESCESTHWYIAVQKAWQLLSSLLYVKSYSTVFTRFNLIGTERPKGWPSWTCFSNDFFTCPVTILEVHKKLAFKAKFLLMQYIKILKRPSCLLRAETSALGVMQLQLRPFYVQIAFHNQIDLYRSWREIIHAGWQIYLRCDDNQYFSAERVNEMLLFWLLCTLWGPCCAVQQY